MKLRSIRASGAEAIVEGPTYDDAVEVAQRIERERGLSFVHPFDDPDVIAGQGTIGLELAEQVPGLAAVVAAVSGGGLIGGLGIALKGGPAPVRVIGASAQNAAAMVASLRAGHPVDVPYLDTLAEVLGGGIGLDNRWSMAAVREFVDEHVLVTEAEIAAAMVFLLSTHRLIAEGGGAVGTGAALAGRLGDLDGPLAIVVSGGNADPAAILALADGAPTAPVAVAPAVAPGRESRGRRRPRAASRRTGGSAARARPPARRPSRTARDQVPRSASRPGSGPSASPPPTPPGPGRRRCAPRPGRCRTARTPAPPPDGPLPLPRRTLRSSVSGHRSPGAPTPAWPSIHPEPVRAMPGPGTS